MVGPSVYQHNTEVLGFIQEREFHSQLSDCLCGIIGYGWHWRI